MLVLSSPSGAGKTTIGRALLERDGDLVMSVSATTRPPRAGETGGRDYFFVDSRTFGAMAEQGEFLEHACVFGHRYGTPRAAVFAALEGGRDVLFDIDWQGARQLRERVRGDLVSVFVLPPSIEELERRLFARGQDSETAMRLRMDRALDEVSHWGEYDYLVVNRDIDSGIDEVHSILRAERRRRNRLVGLAEFVGTLHRERK